MFLYHPAGEYLMHHFRDKQKIARERLRSQPTTELPDMERACVEAGYAPLSDYIQRRK